MVSWSTIKDSISLCRLLSLLSVSAQVLGGRGSSVLLLSLGPASVTAHSLQRMSTLKGENLSAPWVESSSRILVLLSERSRSRSLASFTLSLSDSLLSPALMSSLSRMVRGRQESPPAAPMLRDILLSRRLRYWSWPHVSGEAASKFLRFCLIGILDRELLRKPSLLR